MRVFIAYLVLGVVFAYVCDLRARERTAGARFGSAALSLLAWPLWAPLTLLGQVEVGPVESEFSRRVRAALDEAREAVLGTPLAGLLPDGALTRLHTTLAQVESRHRELCRLLARPEFASSPLPGPHADNVLRLRALEQRERRLLVEVAELAEALRTQLLVARFSGKDFEEEGTRGLLGELGARVESMEAWFEMDV